MQKLGTRFAWIGLAMLLGLAHLMLGILSGGGGARWDSSLGHWIQAWQSPWMDTFFRYLSRLGDSFFPFLLVALIGLVLYRLGWTRELCLLLSGAGSSALLNRLVKFWITSPRPSPQEFRILGSSGSPGYPSGHATFVFFLCGFFLLVSLRRWPPGRSLLPLRLVLGAAPLGVGLSRIYLGLHWPSDVLGGFLGAAAVLAVIRHFYPPAGNFDPPRRTLNTIRQGVSPW